MDVREQVVDYLNLLKMKFAWNEADSVFELIFAERKDEIPASSDQLDEEGYFRYTIKIEIGEKWVQVYTDVYSLENVPEEKRGQVLLDLLAANRKYAEVCFDYDESSKMIGTSQEQMIQGLNFDVFREEFYAVPWAVKKFWCEIASKYDLK